MWSLINKSENYFLMYFLVIDWFYNKRWGDFLLWEMLIEVLSVLFDLRNVKDDSNVFFVVKKRRKCKENGN